VSAPVRRSPIHFGTVLGTAQLTPRMRRVVVRSDSLRGLELRPAQDLELHLQDDSGRRVKRRYTIRTARPELGEVDLDVALHGPGAGAGWGRTAAVGDEIRFQGPRGKLVLADADWHLLCGDESALPAIAAISEAVQQPALAVVECTDAADELPVRAETRWVHRGTTPPGTPELLLAAVERLVLPPGTGHAYLLGETRTMVALRALLEDRGMQHDSIFVKGYWNLGRPDRIHGRVPAADGAQPSQPSKASCTSFGPSTP
jgi:NADPH-dependent ferric siderophore reductase